MTTKAKGSNVPRIGGGRKRGAPIAFDLVVYRDEEEEVHSFNAYAATSTLDTMNLAVQSEGEGVGVIRALARLLAKSMVNTDGVSANWKPEPLPETTGADGEKLPTSYRGPDGNIYPLTDGEQLAKFQDISAGSSRRRWRHLMEEDDGADVEFMDLMEVAKLLISKTAGDPTAT